VSEQESERLSAEESARVRASVDRSFERDAERWRLSYLEHSAQAVRRRALAQANGQG